MNVLVTGGAGFIGTHLTRRLLDEGCRVTILDLFTSQVHGVNKTLSPDLVDRVNLIIGDVRNPADWEKAMEDQEVVVHLAAETGTGQSMYQVSHYSNVNINGTALLMDYLVNHKGHQLKKVVVASSRAIYGEGKYQCSVHGVVYPSMRSETNMKEGRFNPLCPECEAECFPLPTDEASVTAPSSFYGLSKFVQEQMILMFANSLGISGYALRYQNVYGPGQSLKNPYTGILAIFSNLARLNEPINIFEDGKESRDFVYIDDVVEATWRCVAPQSQGVEVFNVGSGVRTSVLEVANEIIKFFGSNSKISVTGAFRLGDIRHNYADITLAQKVIGYQPQWTFEKGIRAFLSWVTEQPVYQSQYTHSLEEMRAKGLFISR